jgi:hypothetical protein
MILTTIIYHVLFLLISVFICLKTIGYALYEINTLNNKFGGISIITFSVLVVIFANVMVWLN